MLPGDYANCGKNTTVGHTINETTSTLETTLVTMMWVHTKGHFILRLEGPSPVTRGAFIYMHAKILNKIWGIFYVLNSLLQLFYVLGGGDCIRWWFAINDLKNWCLQPFWKNILRMFWNIFRMYLITMPPTSRIKKCNTTRDIQKYVIGLRSTRMSKFTL